MRNIKRFFVGTYGTRTGFGPHGLLTVNIPAWVRMVRDTWELFPPMWSRLTRTRLGASSEQVVRDVDPQLGFRVFDKPTSES